MKIYALRGLEPTDFRVHDWHISGMRTWLPKQNFVRICSWPFSKYPSEMVSGARCPVLEGIQKKPKVGLGQFRWTVIRHTPKYSNTTVVIGVRPSPDTLHLALLLIDTIALASQPVLLHSITPLAALKNRARFHRNNHSILHSPSLDRQLAGFWFDFCYSRCRISVEYWFCWCS